LIKSHRDLTIRACTESAADVNHCARRDLNSNAGQSVNRAANIITQHPVALQLRTLQTMAEIATEKNSTIIFPAQFMTTVQEAIAMLNKDSASR
jgi:hypothetical protein